MNARPTILLAALAAALLGRPSQAAPPLTPAALSPCTFAATEVQEVFGLKVATSERSDMNIPRGRDLGCVYTFEGSSLEVQIRQTWDDARPSSASAASEKGAKPLAGDPDGAAWKAGEAERPGSGGELVYTRGKVQVRVVVRGGRLTGTEALQRLLRLRRVP